MTVTFGTIRRDARAALPPFLETLLFLPPELGGFGAKYVQLRENATTTLYRNEHDFQIYLGTYFPRSFAESYTLYKNVLSCRALWFKMATTYSISVLSLGCGTGGDIAGLLQAIHKFRPNVKEVRVVGIDREDRALDRAGYILQKFSRSLSLKLDFTPICYTIGDNQLTGFPVFDNKFDFVQSFKAAGELFAENICDKPYYRFAEKLLPCLNDSGVFSLVDVTYRTKCDAWLPMLLNKQINEFEQANPQYSTLLPVSCGCWGKSCYRERCFSQKMIEVIRNLSFHDQSKIAYRILCRTSLKSYVNVYDTTKRYEISPTGCCANSTKNNDIADNHSLNPYQETV